MAVHLINRFPSRVLKGKTPYHLLFQSPPNYKVLRVFGCLCFVHLPSIERTKLSTHASKCVFLGYNDNQKGYVCYDVMAKKSHISRHVVFLEHISFYSCSSNPVISKISFLPHFPSITSSSTTSSYLALNHPSYRHILTIQLLLLCPTISSQQTDSASDTTSSAPLSRSTHVSKPSDWYDYLAMESIPIPTSYKEACVDNN